MNDSLSEKIDDNKEIPPPEKVSSVCAPHIYFKIHVNQLPHISSNRGWREGDLSYLLDTGEGEAKQIQ